MKGLNQNKHLAFKGGSVPDKPHHPEDCNKRDPPKSLQLRAKRDMHCLLPNIQMSITSLDTMPKHIRHRILQHVSKRTL